MGEEAGWYRDPAPAHPNAPTTLRYWDAVHDKVARTNVACTR